MFAVTNITAAQASDYYKKDNYYLRQGGGEWIGALKEHFGLPGQVDETRLNEMVKAHEKFRTFDVKFILSRDLKDLSHSPDFDKIHRQVIQTILSRVAAEVEKRTGLSISFKKDLDREINTKGNPIMTAISYNVAVGKCPQIKQALKTIPFREEYKRFMAEELEKTGITASSKQFNIQVVENSGRVGFDLTFSAPKSVSIAMTINDSFHQTLKNAHDRAVHDALEYIQENLVEYRVGKNAHREKSQDVLFAKMDHLLSRLQDPQLHSHCILFNTCRGQDGAFRSIANEKLYQKQRFIGLSLYKTQLARYVRDAGFDIEVGKNGQWELKGITREQIQAFSSRWSEIHGYIDAHGLDHQNPRDREIANLATRMKKETHDIEKLQELWSDVRRQHGITEATFSTAQKFEPDTSRLETLDSDMTAHSDAFTREDYMAKAAEIAIQEGLTLQQVEDHFEEKVKHEEFVPFHASNDHKPDSFTLRQIKVKEQKIFDRVLQGVGKSNIQIPDHHYRPRLKASRLTPEQQAAVEHIVTAHDRFSAVNGVAGSGKTHLLKETRAILEAAGYKIQGLAFTGKAAARLEEETGIPSRTIHSYMRTLERTAGYRTLLREGEIQNEWNLTGLERSRSREVWLVDEANMLSVNLMDHLQRGAISRGATVVFIGDYRQLQPIAGGNAFSRMILEDRIDYFDLRTSFRQRRAPSHVREAVRLASEGHLAQSLQKLNRHTIEIESKPERLKSIARAYAALPREDQLESIIITGTNRDRLAINQLTRDYLKASGALPEGVEILLKDRDDNPLTLEMAPGDRVILLKNNHDLNLYNGQTGIVETVQGAVLTIKTPDKILTLDSNDYPYIDHYYACTTWKAEGESFKNVLIQIDTNQHNLNSREDYFVKISRAKETIAVYTDDRHSLLEAVSQSKIPRPEIAVSQSLNRLLLMTPEVSRLLQQGAKWNLRAAHYQTLHTFEPPNHSYSRIQPIARLQKWFRSSRSLSGRAHTRAMNYYDRAIESYKHYLDSRTASVERKEVMLQTFVKNYIPQSGTFPEVPVTTIDEAERKNLLDQFFQSIDHLFEATFTDFTRQDYIDYAMDQALEGEAIRSEIDAHFDSLIEEKLFQPTGELTRDGEEFFQPTASGTDENPLVRRISLGIGQSTIHVAPQIYRPILDKSPLTREQRQAAEFILSAGDQYIALNGVAGSGKTRLVKDVCQVLESEGYTLRGLSFTGKAAYNLSLETGLPCSTMHSYFGALERKAGNDPPPFTAGKIQNQWNFQGLKRSPLKEVWFVDEANMLSDELMQPLLRASAMRGATVVFMGDYRQLQPIDPGNPYTYLIRENKIDYFDLKTSFRQQNAMANVREAVELAAAEKIAASLEKLERHTIEIPGSYARRHEAASSYSDLSPEDRRQSVIISGTNADRIMLNDIVRQNLKLKGELSDGRTLNLKTPNDHDITREMSRGDRVILLRNDKALGVFNGQTGIVQNVKDTQLTIETPQKTLTIDTRKYPYLDHFYACTTWKAEGDSYKYATLYFNTWQSRLNCRQDYYVKISRAKNNTLIFTNNREGLFDEVVKSAIANDYGARYESGKQFDYLDQKIQHNLAQAARHYLQSRQYDAIHCPNAQTSPESIARFQSAKAHHLYLSLHYYQTAQSTYERALNNSDPNSTEPDHDKLTAFKTQFIPPQISQIIDHPDFTPSPRFEFPDTQLELNQPNLHTLNPFNTSSKNDLSNVGYLSIIE